jgi:hypothetical protein
VEGEVAGRAVADLLVSNRVEVLVGRPRRVGLQIRELCGTGILVCQRNDREIVLGIGQPRGLGPEQREYLDVVASAGLVAEGFKSDSGTRGRGEGLSLATADCRVSNDEKGPDDLLLNL